MYVGSNRRVFERLKLLIQEAYNYEKDIRSIKSKLEFGVMSTLYFCWE